MKPEDNEAEAAQRAKECAKSILQDEETQKILREVFASYSDVDIAAVLNNIAATVSVLHFMLPLNAAKERHKRRAAMQRAIKIFRDAVDTFQRQSGLFLPSPSDVLYRETPLNDIPDYLVRRLPSLEIDHYLGCLDEYLFDPATEKTEPKEKKPARFEDGNWVHPYMATGKHQWPRTADSAARIWIIRTLDNYGVPREGQKALSHFLQLALRLVDVLNDSRLPCVLTLSRKDFTDDDELRPGKGQFQWRPPRF